MLRLLYLALVMALPAALQNPTTATSVSSGFKERECVPDKSSGTFNRILNFGTCSCSRLSASRLWIRMRRFRTIRSQVSSLRYFNTAFLIETGIHGVPFKPWDKVEPAPGQDKMGYCPHSSSIFGPWHRPYLALFEQILHDRAVDVAKEYPIGQARNKALELAARVRLPYWDWARNSTNPEDGVIPKILRVERCTVTFPNGTSGEIFNPLYKYKFHPLPKEVFGELVCNSVRALDLQLINMFPMDHVLTVL